MPVCQVLPESAARKRSATSRIGVRGGQIFPGSFPSAILEHVSVEVVHRVRRVFPAVFFAFITFVPVWGTSPSILPPNATAYSATELETLLAALSSLRKDLSDDYLGSYRTLSEWGSRDFAAYTAGTLARLGYETRLVAAGGWPEGTHAFILVGIPLAGRTAWIPVEASPPPGRAQESLGLVPLYTDSAGELWFEKAYLGLHEEVRLPENLPPVAKIRLSPLSGKVGEGVTFMAVDSYDLDGEIVRYSWDLGDGRVSSAPTVHHIFKKAGTYLVSLTVIDARGASTTATAAFIVADLTFVPFPGSSGRGCGCGR